MQQSGLKSLQIGILQPPPATLLQLILEQTNRRNLNAGLLGILRLGHHNIQRQRDNRTSSPAQQISRNLLRRRERIRLDIPKQNPLKQIRKVIPGGPIEHPLRRKDVRTLHQRQRPLLRNDIQTNLQTKHRGAEQTHTLSKHRVGHDSSLEQQRGRQDISLKSPRNATRKSECELHGQHPILSQGFEVRQRHGVGETEHSSLHHGLEDAPGDEAVPYTGNALLGCDLTQHLSVGGAGRRGLHHDLHEFQEVAHCSLVQEGHERCHKEPFAEFGPSHGGGSSARYG
mmetsp:Transcript_14541/g.21443  ORF Transcript_14541/g.21443 Transcript_14541/m.21443 type:complete len:285 (-) Transcript_14541:622-1476(-)